MVNKFKYAYFFLFLVLVFFITSCNKECRHKEVVIPGRTATCISSGVTMGKKCSLCGEILEVQKEIPALGHTEVYTVKVKATCTEEGSRIITCKKCDYLKTEKVPAKGHDYTQKVTEPTCTEQGYTTYTCTVCNDEYVADYVNELGHKAVVDAAKEATCTETGLTEGSHCLVCNEVIVARKIVKKIKHNFIGETCSICSIKVSEGLFYRWLSDGTYEVAGIGTCISLFIIVPSTHNGKKVTSIGESAFAYCSLASVEIPESVTSIGNYAFYNCENLKSIEIPNSVTSIGRAAFENCKNLKSIEIPNSVTSIGWDAFENCTSLKSITIPESVTSIRDGTFYNCTSLESITISEGITYIGYEAFRNCTSLESITIPEGVTYIRDEAFRNCTSLLSVVIPSSVTSIGLYAFRNCTSLESITLPFVGASPEETNYTHFGYIFDAGTHLSNFDNVPQSLKEVIITNATSIEKNAFHDCASLERITILDGVTSIGDEAFYNCTSLVSIVIPESVTYIGDEAFICCTSLESVEIPNSVTSIGDSAFSYCYSLKSITIPNSVTSIGRRAFYKCSNLTIYCESTSQPAGWSSSWNYSDCPVVWDYTNKKNIE